MTEDEDRPVKSRKTDTTNRDARLAIADVSRSLEALRSKTALIFAKAVHGVTAAERNSLLAECDDLTAASREARRALLIALMDAPPKVAGHSRVIDVEKAIDSLEASIEQARVALG